MKSFNLFFCASLIFWIYFFSVEAIAATPSGKVIDESQYILEKSDVKPAAQGTERVNSVRVDTKGTVYVGMMDGGLSVATKPKQGTSYQFKNYDTRSGLGSNDIHDVLADKGVIYAATDNGVSVGTKEGSDYQFKNSRLKYEYAGFITSYVHRLKVDTKGRIYAGTSGGLSIGKKQGKTGYYYFKNYGKESGLTDSFIQSLYVDAKRTIYVGTWSGLFIGRENIIKGGYQFRNNSRVLGLTNEYVESIYVDAKGVLYVGTVGGLFIKEKNVKSQFKHYDIGIDHFYSSGQKGASLRKKFHRNGNHVESIYVDAKGIIYAGTEDGLSIGEKDTKGNYQFTRFYKNSELGTSDVYCVYVDGDGVIYAGTNKGLYIATPSEMSANGINPLAPN